MDVVKQETSKRCEAIASFMESLLDDTENNRELRVDILPDSGPVASERGSLLLGDISPLHNSYDSLSTETPPTYNQLNYNENLIRFFNSNPTTVGTDEAMKVENNPTDSDDSPLGSDESRDSKRSGGNSSAESSEQTFSPFTSNTNSSTGSSQNIKLTEDALTKHNDEMVKCMLKKRKEAKSSSRSTVKLKKESAASADYGNLQGHGIKRSGSQSWEEEIHKNSKQQHISDCENHANNTSKKAFCTQSDEQDTREKTPPSRPLATRGVELWPPFSVSVTMVENTHTTTLSQCSATQNGYFPAVYCIPYSQANATIDQKISNSFSYAYFQYMTGLIYPHPTLPGQNLFYPQPPSM